MPGIAVGCADGLEQAFLPLAAVPLGAPAHMRRPRSLAGLEVVFSSTGGDAASTAAGAATFFLRGMAFSPACRCGLFGLVRSQARVEVCFGAPTRGGTFFPAVLVCHR